MTNDEGFLLDPFQFTPASLHILDGDRDFFSSVLEENLAYQHFWINLTRTGQEGRHDTGWSWRKVLHSLSFKRKYSMDKQIMKPFNLYLLSRSAKCTLLHAHTCTNVLCNMYTSDSGLSVHCLTLTMNFFKFFKLVCLGKCIVLH